MTTIDWRAGDHCIVIRRNGGTRSWAQIQWIEPDGRSAWLKVFSYKAKYRSYPLDRLRPLDWVEDEAAPDNP